MQDRHPSLAERPRNPGIDLAVAYQQHLTVPDYRAVAQGTPQHIALVSMKVRN
jgi:hypothetical protein